MLGPRLINPVPVFIRKADPDNTAAVNTSLHEPVGQMRRFRDPIKLLAQISYIKMDNPVPTAGGINEISDGYLVFQISRLRKMGIMVDRGDQVTQIGQGRTLMAVDYYITKIQPLGHTSLAKGATLIKAYFADRQPTRQRPINSGF